MESCISWGEMENCKIHQKYELNGSVFIWKERDLRCSTGLPTPIHISKIRWLLVFLLDVTIAM